MAHQFRALVPLPMLVVLLTACGLPQPPVTRYDVAQAQVLPPCTHAGKALSLPPKFPNEFPIPAGAVVSNRYTRRDGSLVLSGFILSHNFGATLKFFEDYLPLSGFSVTRLPSKGGQVVDESYAGHGWAGILYVYPFPGNVCPGVVVFGATAVRGNTPPVDTY